MDFVNYFGENHGILGVIIAGLISIITVLSGVIIKLIGRIDAKDKEIKLMNDAMRALQDSYAEKLEGVVREIVSFFKDSLNNQTNIKESIARLVPILEAIRSKT